MADAWFTDVADELARCLVDALRCAESCERLLASPHPAAQRKTAFDALVAPVAVAQVLIELIDYPPQIALAAARLLADTADAGAARLAELGRPEADEAIAALRRAAASAHRLLEAAG
jgi:hypothetical protein